PVEALELRDALDKLVMAEPALVIKNLLPSFGPARGGFPELVDFQRSLIVILRRRAGLLRGCPRDRACGRRDQRAHRDGPEPSCFMGAHDFPQLNMLGKMIRTQC